ncbi:MAG TPA: hypothetical protein VGI20_04995 [Rhizomicrobium sp.]|jgi:hypothetical protein
MKCLLQFLAIAAGAMPAAAVAQSRPPAVCIRTLDIDHTKAPDNRTILFYMKDGRIWSTTLVSYCPELTFNGFAYGPTPPDNICGNMQTIRVLRSGAVCEMGPLVPVTPKPASQS